MYKPGKATCSMCGEREKRPGQRTCKMCHAVYMKEHRKGHVSVPVADARAIARAAAKVYGKLKARQAVSA